MNFSIILASRERVHLLDGLLNSIVNTISDKNNCEVVCVIDNDDRVTKRFLDRLQTSCPFARFISRERAFNLNDDYLNWAWRHFTTGDNIIVVNDDVLFKTPGWDHIIMANLSRYLADKPDGVAYGKINDGIHVRANNLPFSCFPLVTRRGAEVLGFVMPPDFPGWGADIGIYRIYSAINRVCELGNIFLEHVSHHTGSRPRDHISHGVEEKSKGSIHPIEQFDIGPHVDKLFRYVGGDASLGKSVTVTGATIIGATLVDVTIIGGKIVNGRVIGGRVEGGRVQGGVLKSGTVEDGELQSGYIAGPGGLKLVD